MKNILLYAVLGAGVLYFVLTSKPASALPSTTYIPSESDILGASNMTQLDTYYELINELYVEKMISASLYDSLYTAYQTRYGELS